MIGSAPTVSVSDFVAIFNQTMDMTIPIVGIVGELSNYRVSKGAWVYFDLKDEESSVAFFGSVRALPGPLEDGMMLEVIGRPYLHPKFGFSVQLQAITPIGKGTIKQAKDLLAGKLRSEGLFDESRKRPLPYPPCRIGLISSIESAGYSDFIKIITARWPSLEITIFDVLVQGVDAPEQIVTAIVEANQMNNLECLVIVRGGGSSDDLITFDHELVARAVAGSRLPTLVGVGHERDVTLAELAADVRASTPSNAAELIVPDRISEIRSLITLKEYIDSSITNKIQAVRTQITITKELLDTLLDERLRKARSDLLQAQILLRAIDPKQLLNKGYVFARGSDGKIIRTAKMARASSSFTVEFSDDLVEVKVQ